MCDEGGHGGRFAVIRGSAVQRATWGNASRDACFIIATEVLDNLPHDKIVRAGPGQPWHQTVVEPAEGATPSGGAGSSGAGAGASAGSGCASSDSSSAGCSGADRRSADSDGASSSINSGGGIGGSSAGGGDGSIACGPWREALQPLSDPLIQRCVTALYGDSNSNPTAKSSSNQPTFKPSWWQRAIDYVAGIDDAPNDGVAEEIAFVPTGCLELLETMHDARPHHLLLAADFDWLPDVKVAGVNAPLVSSRVRRGGAIASNGALYRYGFSVSLAARPACGLLADIVADFRLQYASKLTIY